MDDDTRLGGWVPVERPFPHHIDPEPITDAPDAGRGGGSLDSSESLFAPEVSPPSSPNRVPSSARRIASTGPPSSYSISASSELRPSDTASNRLRPSDTASNRLRPSDTASNRLRPSYATSESASASTGLFGLLRLSTVLRFAQPSTWHPPARLGSGPVRRVRLLLARHRRVLAVCLTLAGLWITIRSAAPQPPPTVPVLVAARDLPAGRTLTSADLRPGTWPADHAPSGRLTAAVGLMLASPIRTGELMTDARVVGPGLLRGQSAGTVAMPVRLGDPAASTLVKAGDRVDVLVSPSSSEPDLADGTDPSDAAGQADNTSQTDSAGHTDNRSTSSTAADRGSGAERVAAGALVLAVPGTALADDGSWSGSTGAGLGGLAGGALPGASSGESSAAGLLVLAVSSSEASRLAAVQSGLYIGIAVLPHS